jgi:hypothetical protein
VNAQIEEQARARGGLVAIEPIIDNLRFVVADEALAGLLEAARHPLGDRDCAALTEDGARRALLARIAAVGGSLVGETRARRTSRQAAFPLGYRGRDAIAALIGAGRWWPSASMGSRRGCG